MTAPIDLVLARLAPYKMRENGPDRWRACCPAHGGSNPSALSVGVGNDGTVLLKCWHGCSAEEVAGALGFELSDLFPPHDCTHRAAGPASKLKLPAAQALEILNRESLLIYIVGNDMHQRRKLADADFDRLAVAVRRVGQIVEATR